MKTRRLLAALIGGTALMTASIAGATTFEAATFSDNVAAASAAVIGTVQSQEVVRRNGQVVTLTTFARNDSLFGGMPSTFVVATPGGRTTLGRLEIAEVVPGSPNFFIDQKSMLLLTSGTQAGEYALVGLGNGVFSVTNAPDGSNLIALPGQKGTLVNRRGARQILRQNRRNNPGLDIQ